MSEYEAIVAAVSIIFGTSTAVAVTWIIARAVLKARSLSSGGAIDELAISRIESRLDRIEQALDSVAVEVERVSEGQRFTTRLLSERVEGQR